MHPDIQIFIQSFNKTGIGASSTPEMDTRYPIRCNYICNTDGSIRWIWPAKSKHADFIKFYHATGLRPKLFALAAQLLAKLNLLILLKKGSFYCYISEQNGLRIEKTWSNRWAWFSGTMGPNRKTILWHPIQKFGSAVFLKIPLTELATKNIAKETAQLIALAQLKQNLIVLPQVTSLNHDVLQLQDIGEQTQRYNRLHQLPLAPLKTWLEIGLVKCSYQTSSFKAKLDEMLLHMSQLTDPRIPKQIIYKMNLWRTTQKPPITFTSTYSHGDFTPWNVMVKNEKLHLIDLELSHIEMPMLFDVFHYVYQANILIGNNGYTSIRNELDALFQLPAWIVFLQKHQIDTRAAECLYLQYTVAYHLVIYQQQQQWHVQIGWLLSTWNEALSYHLNAQKGLSTRKLLLIDMEQYLQPKQYAVLKWLYGSITSLPEEADIDICIKRGDAQCLVAQLKTHPLIAKMNILPKSFMTHLEIFGVDGSLIHLDLIYTFKRKTTIFLNAAALLAHAIVHPGKLKIPAPEDDAEYIRLFYSLNHATVPQKYQAYFQPKPQKPSNAINLGNRNKGWNKTLNLLNYLRDTVKEYFSVKGFIVTFSGVDGAGKSTVIEHIRVQIAKKLRQRVIVIRHRPSILPIISAWKYGKQKAEQNAANRLPRLGKNSSVWSSLLRFGYYYLDYVIGQWYIQFWYVSRGYIVLYDRYYFDFICDTKRSNLQLPQAFTKWCYRLLIQPKLNFFLYASEAAILKRKQELDANTITQLTANYLKLFNNLTTTSTKALYIPVENIVLNDTLAMAFNHIKTVRYESNY